MDSWNVCPTVPAPANLDGSGRMAWLALSGYPRLSADTILSKELKGKLELVVGNAVRRLNLEFVRSKQKRKDCYETLVETALNLSGLERKRAGFPDKEAELVLNQLTGALKAWEERERKDGGPVAIMEVVESQISGMKKVLFGKGMVSKMGEAIEKAIDEKNIAGSFLEAARREIQGNVYHDIVDRGFSKLGNDSATGLRWLRHLGAVQVSSNPVIAARAYEELPDLWEKFRAILSAHPEWQDSPEKSADEVAMYATIIGLLPNLLDFRPIALLSNFEEGMVSIQLNPFRASSRAGSLEDAQKIYSVLQEILSLYDTHLMGASDFEGKGRPNVVFKVASGNPAAIEITEALNRLGIGTNNTVTFTASQEIYVAMAAMRGLAFARKIGIPITRVYVTNMEGRLEDHLREAQAASLLKAHLAKSVDPQARLNDLAQGLRVREEVEKAGTLAEKVSLLCARKNLKALTEDWFMKLFPRSTNVAQMEKDIRWAGILVTRKVYGLAFGPKAALKWAKYLQRSYGLPPKQAREVVSRVDLLPASKRREEDTYLVLGKRNTANLTNTEFPDQQLKVWVRSHEKGFRLARFENSIAARPDPAVLKRLLKMEDFRRAYELTEPLSKELGGIGFPLTPGRSGLGPDEWESYGPVVKTMREFKGAYKDFKDRLLPDVEQRQTVTGLVSR